MQTTIVQVSSASGRKHHTSCSNRCPEVTTLGFSSLIRATSELHSVAGLDLSNSQLAHERCYPYLTRALTQGELAHLNILRLSHMELGDTHICALAQALSGHPELEILCVAGNK